MAEVYVQTNSSDSSSSSSSYITSRRETFTLWMKSLLFHGKGCTVFDSEGKLVYRIDNYCGRKSSCREDVELMDLRGDVLFSLRQKKTPVFGYKVNDDHGNKVEQRTPCFQVRKIRKVLRGGSVYYVVSRPGIELGDETTSTPTTTCYRIQGLSGKLGFLITDGNGILLAEVEQKRSSSSTGIVFGKDVLTLAVEPHVDHSLMMAFVSAYELINHNL